MTLHTQGGVTPWLKHQVLLEASNHGGSNASLLAQQLDGRLASVDSLQIDARFRLAVILSADKALLNLGTFAFVVSHLLSAGRRHSYGFAELIRIIERLKELHTEVQGMISSPHLATTLIYDMLRRWSQ